MDQDTSVPMPMPPSTAEKICDACVRVVGSVSDDDSIRGQDPLSVLGIEDPDAIEDLVNALVKSKKGVASAGYTIPDANKLRISKSTTFSQLESAVIAVSQPSKAKTKFAEEPKS